MQKYIKDYYCTGIRTCEKEGCQGGVAPVLPSRPLKNNTYYYNEATTGIRCPTSGNTNYSMRDNYCDGSRTCSDFGWCQGTARPPKDVFYYYD